MTGFSNAESPEEFKHRLNSLTEKLNNTQKTGTKHQTRRPGFVAGDVEVDRGGFEPPTS